MSCTMCRIRLCGAEGKWLVDTYAVTTLPSASVLGYLKGKAQGASQRVLVVGNPDLGPALNLRYAEAEARSVSERYPGRATVLLRKEATERGVKEVGPETGILHFATHADELVGL